MKRTIALLLLAVAWLLACSGDESPPQTEAPNRPVDTALTQPGDRLAAAMSTPEFEIACADTPGCADAAPTTGTETELAWRVRVIREASADIRIASIDAIEVVAGDGLPVGAIYGEYAVVGLTGDQSVVDGQVIHFPKELRVESADQVSSEPIDLAGKQVDAIVYLQASPDIAALAVRDRDGNTLDTAAPPASVDTAWFDRVSRFMGVDSAYAITRPFNSLPPHCAHVIVLQGEEDRQLFTGAQWENNSRLGWPGPYQLAATRAALARMTPMLCQAIGRIAFAWVEGFDDKLGAVNSFGAGDTLVINISTLLSEEALETMLNRRLMLQETITHEAGHAAETLLTVESSGNDRILERNYSGSWGFPARTLAKKTIDNVRLEVGMASEWRRMHNSFVAPGWAGDWGQFVKEEGVPPSWDRKDITNNGFISYYASTNWAEDIADTIAHAYYAGITGESYDEHGVSHMRQDYGCVEMRAYSKQDLPSRYASLYAKLYFLRDLGLVTDEGVDYCTGDHLTLPIDGPGFHVWLRGEKRRSYDTGVTASIGTKENGVPVFDLRASGRAGFGDSMYETTAHLRLDVGNRFQEFGKVSWPRGVYVLGLAGNNNFQLRLDGAPAGNFDVMDGFALVAESSANRIAGSVVIQRVFRLNAPLPVPELYDPPLVMRFMIDK